MKGFENAFKKLSNIKMEGGEIIMIKIMNKTAKMFMLALIGVFLVTGTARAIPIGNLSYTTGNFSGISLQDVLDNITVGPVAGTSSVDVTTDFLSDAADSYWELTASGNMASTMIIELAGFALTNTFGVYDSALPASTVQLFAGSAVAGNSVTLGILLDGSILVNNVDTGVDFGGNSFGFYLDSSTQGGGGLFYSDSSLNAGGLDYMAAYQGTDTDTVQLPNHLPGLWTDNEFILAWEDVVGLGDQDYNDMVLMVESVKPVPEPGTILLLGSGFIGMFFFRRRKKV